MPDALLIVDVQNDFCEGGSLAVVGGAAVAERVNELTPAFALVVATMDFHIDPGDHFADEPDFIDTWPRHCVAGTVGAQLHPALDPRPLDAIFYKGAYAAAYSGFEGRNDQSQQAGSSLDEFLRDHGVDAVTIVGLATDHCVVETALDARRAGFRTTVDTRYCAGVAPATTSLAIQRMREAEIGLR